LQRGEVLLVLEVDRPTLALNPYTVPIVAAAAAPPASARRCSVRRHAARDALGRVAELRRDRLRLHAPARGGKLCALVRPR
jgi:hypothetical protein